MNQTIKFLLFVVTLGTLTACDETGDQIVAEEMTIPKGYALSAGTSTVFFNSAVAYDQPAKWVSGVYDTRFTRGDQLYDNVKTINNNGHMGGLGPVYAGYSCGSCHRNAGRTEPTLWTQGGSGTYGFTSALIYVTRKNGAFFPDYGRVIHDNAIYGVQPEGKLRVTWDFQKFQFPDGEAYELAKRA